MGKVSKNGRPRKFNDDELLKIVKNYVENEHNKNEEIKITKLAENLRNKGLNIVYQDINRYEDVKKYIQEYNIRLKQGLNNDDTAKNVNKGGRPRKFNEDDLLIAVKGYIKSLNKAQTIKVSRVAKYFQDKGINLTYQDLNRYPKVHKFIQDYNEKYKEILFRGVIEVNIEKQKCIFEQINVDDFLKKNKTTKEIEKALLTLNQTNEKLVENTEKLQNKIILQNEKIITQSIEIDNLKSMLQSKEIELENKEKEYQEKNKKNKEKILKFNRRMAIYDQFINKYHYANLVEYALSLEENLNIDGIKKIDGFIDKEKYKNGELTLKDIADKYFYFQLAVENAINDYIKKEDEQYEYKLDKDCLDEYIEKCISNKVNDKEKSFKSEKGSENGIESMNLSIDDLNSILSIIDDI